VASYLCFDHPPLYTGRLFATKKKNGWKKGFRVESARICCHVHICDSRTRERDGWRVRMAAPRAAAVPFTTLHGNGQYYHLVGFSKPQYADYGNFLFEQERRRRTRFSAIVEPRPFKDFDIFKRPRSTSDSQFVNCDLYTRRAGRNAGAQNGRRGWRALL